MQSSEEQRLFGLKKVAAVIVSFSLVAAAQSVRATEAASVDEQSVPQPSAGARDDLAEVVVTGSRIARPDLERLEPTTVLSSKFLEERAYSNVIDALNEIPAFGLPDNSLKGGQSAFGVGQSFANYFSLGSQRTLTLVDGRRFVPANSPSIFGATGNGGEQVDLNVIPTLLIDRIETIAVGGAPTYGSDAIAGTVNIILKHDFEGLLFAGEGGISTHRDAPEERLRILGGKNFADGRGNIEISAELANSAGLQGTQRQRYLDDNAFLTPPTSAMSPYQYLLYANRRLASINPSGVPMTDDGYLNLTPGVNIFAPDGSTLSFSNGHLAPYNIGPADGSHIYNLGGDGIDFGKISTILSPQERINGTVLSHFDVNEHLKLFSELWYSETHNAYPSDQGAYDTALFAGAGQVSGNLLLNVNNPFLSAADQATIAQNLAAYAAVPGNPTQTSQFYLARLNQDIGMGGASADQNTKRAVFGVKGDFNIGPQAWNYEVSGNYGRTTNTSISPSLNFNNFTNALNSVLAPDGSIQCATPYPTSPVPTQSNTCAPFNPFGYGIASRAAFAYVTDLARATSVLTQRDFVASASGGVFHLPGGTVKIAVGYENRRESADFEPDQFYQQGLGYSIPIGPIEGSFLTNEVFGETTVPFISPDMNIPGVNRLEADVKGRLVHHSIAGSATTWTAGARYEPVGILQFRGNYTRAIRSPSVTEAFNPTSQAFDTATDPCDSRYIGAGPNPATRAANCAKAGITQPFTSDIVSFTEPITVSGDPTLKNEIADSRTFGFVLRPLPRMSLTVDYVSIDIEQAIVSLSTTDVLTACYDDPSYPNADCSRITRGGDGQVSLVKTGYGNAGFYNFNGITGELNYSFDLPFGETPGSWGTVDFRVNHFFMNHLSQSVGATDTSAFAGQVGYSKHKGVIDIGWTKDPIFALWQARYTGHAIWDNTDTPDFTPIQGLGTWWVHDLTVGATPIPNLKIQLLVSNIFDKQAPYPLPAVPNTPNGVGGISNYFSGVLGRYFTLSAQYKL